MLHCLKKRKKVGSIYDRVQAGLRTRNKLFVEGFMYDGICMLRRRENIAKRVPVAMAMISCLQIHGEEAHS